MRAAHVPPRRVICSERARSVGPGACNDGGWGLVKLQRTQPSRAAGLQGYRGRYTDSGSPLCPMENEVTLLSCVAGRVPLPARARSRPLTEPILVVHGTATDQLWRLPDLCRCTHRSAQPILGISVYVIWGACSPPNFKGYVYAYTRIHVHTSRIRRAHARVRIRVYACIHLPLCAFLACFP